MLFLTVHFGVGLSGTRVQKWALLQIVLPADELSTSQSLGQSGRWSSQPQGTEIGFSERFLAALCLAKWAETGCWGTRCGGCSAALLRSWTCFPAINVQALFWGEASTLGSWCVCWWDWQLTVGSCKQGRGGVLLPLHHGHAAPCSANTSCHGQRAWDAIAFLVDPRGWKKHHGKIVCYDNQFALAQNNAVICILTFPHYVRSV